ncbi:MULTISPECIES: MFS transporter [unclassified Candidatus Tisiphia]|uniref:MFS transporter n=1 Tax=unclassified Candidatus Tisiphia TaxID=2996318 RepID=UPI00312CADF3
MDKILQSSRKVLHTQTHLTSKQKSSVSLLLVGTCLEYFDLMLYIHLAILLNDLFFPKTDPQAASLLAALTFCLTYIFRPVGALIFGYIGDHIGYKTTIVITTFMMATSCFTIAVLPTYEQIGIISTWVIIICRIIQGVSSVGEIIGSELYLNELTKPPIQYPVISLVSISTIIGGVVALGISSLSTSFGFSWRMAFWIGTIIAVIGIIARTHLKETASLIKKKALLTNSIQPTRANIKTMLAYFFIQCGWPICFYFAYIHCSNILKNSYGYTAVSVIHHNFILSVITLGGYLIFVYLSYKVYPLLILKIRLAIFCIFVISCPWLLDHYNTPSAILMIQLITVVFGCYTMPADAIFFRHIPIFKRCTHVSLSFTLSRTLMHLIAAFGLVHLIKYFGNYGLLFLMIPISLGFTFGIYHFEKLEKQAGYY